MRSTKSSKAVLGAIAGLSLGVAVWSPASADFFGGRYADNDQHRYASTESNNADHNALDPAFSGSMYSDFELDTGSDINTINDGRSTGQPPSTVDVYWFAADQSVFSHPGVWGDALCVDTQGSNHCDQSRVRFNEDTLIGASSTQQAHTICHEISHTLGSDDGDTDNKGCFPQSGFSLDGDLDGDEIDHLQAQY